MATILGYYFDEAPKKSSASSNILEVIEGGARHSIRELQLRMTGNCVAPILLCLDDMQNYDELSFKIVKMVLRRYERVMVVGLVRDQFLDFNLYSKGRPQEEVFIEKVQEIESILE